MWCLDAKDGSLVWQSDPITSALNVVTVGEQFIFSNALRGRGNVFDRKTGKVVGGVDHNYACCRFTMSGLVHPGRQHGHDRPRRRRQAGLDRPRDRLARVPGRGRLQRPHLLHLAGQRLLSSRRPTARTRRSCPRSGSGRNSKRSIHATHYLLIRAARASGNSSHRLRKIRSSPMPPRVTRAGDGFEIAFTVDKPTDVEVAIVNRDGRVIRHLTAGVLGGENPPPAPLKAGLKQQLVWDGKNDDGKAVAHR